MLAAILWSGLIMSGPSGLQPTAWARGGVAHPGDLGLERQLIPLEVGRRIRREPGAGLVLEEHIRYDDGSARHATYRTPWRSQAGPW